MNHLCESCSICSFLPTQDKPRVFKVEVETSPSPLVLVIDQIQEQRQLDSAILVADILLAGVKYTYTPSIRCEYVGASFEDYQKAIARCAVWTNQLLPGRSVILSTVPGVYQMKVKGEVTPGQIFRSEAFGLVLVIPPLVSLGTGTDLPEYQSKVKRLLKKANLL